MLLDNIFWAFAKAKKENSNNIASAMREKLIESNPEIAWNNPGSMAYKAVQQIGDFGRSPVDVIEALTKTL